MDRRRPHGFCDGAALLERGADVAVWNRTKSKAEPLAANGATVVESPADLADRDIVFTMVGGPADFVQVTLGDGGVLAQDQKPKMLIDRPPSTRRRLPKSARRLNRWVCIC